MAAQNLKKRSVLIAAKSPRRHRQNRLRGCRIHEFLPIRANKTMEQGQVIVIRGFRCVSHAGLGSKLQAQIAKLLVGSVQHNGLAVTLVIPSLQRQHGH